MVSAYLCWRMSNWVYAVHEEGLLLEVGRVPGAQPTDGKDVLAFLLRRRWPMLDAGRCRVGARPAPAVPPPVAPLRPAKAEASAACSREGERALSGRPASLRGA